MVALRAESVDYLMTRFAFPHHIVLNFLSLSNSVCRFDQLVHSDTSERRSVMRYWNGRDSHQESGSWRLILSAIKLSSLESTSD